MKRFLIICLAMTYMIVMTFNVVAVSDREILSDPVANVYQANSVGETITNNIDFSDVPASHWAKEPITRLGALLVVKGYNEGNRGTYRPDQPVSREEAMAFLLRVIGQEGNALLASEALEANEEDPTLTIWSRGYLQLARNLNLITQEELDDALTLDQGALDPTINFMRSEPISREEVSKWIIDAINFKVPNSIDPNYEPQEIFTTSDWEQIDNELIPYVEAVMREDIMVGDGNRFDPKGQLTRAQMAQIIVNIDEILYNTMDLNLKGGVVGSIEESMTSGPLGNETKRTILIRNEEGLVDQVDLTYKTNDIGQVASLDVPVYNGEEVTGLKSLKEGDYISYVVDDLNKEMKYIHSKGLEDPIFVKGVLQPLNNLEADEITLENASGAKFTYKLIDGLYDETNETIKVGITTYPVSDAPVSNTVTLTLKNDLVTHIDYEGAIPLSTEISGIVKEINQDLGFMTIESWNGHEVTKYFNQGNVIVEKQNYYDDEDEIGYIDEMFPEFGFDERDTTIDAVEAGDIVHVLLSPKDIRYIDRVSAKTNYTVKFGEVIDLNHKGTTGMTLRVQYDDGSIGTLDVDAMVPVMESGVNIGTKGLEQGEMVKVLLNQAVLAPGQTVESVKHIEVDPYGNVYSKIYKGEYGNYDSTQGTIAMLNSYELSNAGWTNHTQQTTLELPAKEYELFHEGKRISVGYADNFLRTEDMKIYAVTREHYGREVVSRIVFEDGRGEVLTPSNVVYSNGYDTMKMVSKSQNIGVNPGTIVVKNNHVVGTTSIISPDYAQVVLGDATDAVIVNVMQEPNNDAISVMRGRIMNIQTGESVKVTSHATLKDMTWVYSPIARTYTMSYDTKIIDENGIQPLESFIDYSELTKIDEVYTVIAEGTKATHLVKNPYATEGVVGQLYEVEDGTVKLKDALVYHSESKLWNELSYKNSYAEIETDGTTIVIKNNKVVTLDDLAFGDQVRAMVTEDLAEKVKLENNHTTTGYVLFVEE